MGTNKKIKIIIAINDFLVGGAQTLILKQLKYFDNNRFEFYLISLFDFQERTNLYNLIPENVKVFRLNFKNFLDLKNWYKLFILLRKINPEIVISNLFFSNTVFRILKLFFWKLKIIIIEHNTYIHKTKLQIFLDKILSKITYKIIAVSDTVADFTSRQEKINIDKFQAIFNGVDVEDIFEFTKANSSTIDSIKQKLGFDVNDKIIINVARLTQQKKLDLLIDCFYELNKSKNNCKLIILGDGGLKDELQQKIGNLQLSEKVFLLGAKQNINDYYMISDLFVLTSEIEGFALVCIEAMAFGIPVVSTRVAGPDKYVKDYNNGFLADSNIKDLVEKIIFMFNLRDEEIIEYKKNCIETAKIFDIRKNVEQCEKLFLDCLKR